MSGTEHERRSQAASQAYRALGGSPARHRVLAVHCASGHHVAGVYRCAGGDVYVSRTWARGHGDRDRHDAAHHGGHRDTPWVDWLAPGDPAADDALPAGCECGPRSLSRALLRKAVDSGDVRVVID